ncbi:MAG: hypothetical protein EOM23_05470, partial [Candidatus Moranbacteria bacterium]|nr:hypothetical protein [Candidatus Moranbacteria bacterium]
MNKWSDSVKIILTVFISYVISQLFLGSPLRLLALVLFVGFMLVSICRPLWFLISLVVIQEKLFQSIDIGIDIYLYTDLVIVLLGGAIVFQFLLRGWPKDLHKNFYFLAILTMLTIILFSIFFG